MEEIKSLLEKNGYELKTRYDLQYQHDIIIGRKIENKDCFITVENMTNLDEEDIENINKTDFSEK